MFFFYIVFCDFQGQRLWQYHMVCYSTLGPNSDRKAKYTPCLTEDHWMGRWWCFLRLVRSASQSSLSCVEELAFMEAQQPVD